MIKQLRRKFIVVAMSSIFAVLFVIVGILDIADYCRVMRRADGILEMLAENDGRFPEMPNPGAFPIFDRMTPETPFETRFFSVGFDAAGEVLWVDTGRIAAVKTSDAIAYAKQIRASGKQKGFYGSYRFLQTGQDHAGSRVFFVDCSKDLNVFRDLVITGAAVSLAGLLAVFGLVVFFSRRVFRPVEEVYAKQKRFVTDAGHELKTPLTIISADVDILEMEGQPNEWTAGIRRQVARLSTLTEQMVTLSRMDEEDGRMQFAECDLTELTRETVAAFEPLAQASGKELSAEIAEGILCQADAEKLRQMLTLLLDNAVKYSAKQGRILVKLESCGKSYGKKERVRLTVQNTLDPDSGILPGSQEKLFERFYRPDASRNSRTGGSGIGLSIVKAVVELHHGKISAQSEDGSEICFTILL